MDPTFYHQWSPPTRLGGRAVPQSSMGLYISIPDESEVVKAVPIIGESKAPKATPALVSPKGESLANPVVPTKDVRSSSQPKILGQFGQQVHAETPKPSIFAGSTAGPTKPSSPSSIVTPGPKPSAGGVATTPYIKPAGGPTPSIVDPQGKPVSSKLTEGPGAAKQDPKLAIPSSLAPKPMGSEKIETTSSSARPGSKVTADEAQWSAAIGAAKKREATAAGYAAERRSPLDFTPKPQAPAEKPKYADVQATETAQALTAATTPGDRKLMAAGGMKDPKPTAEGGGLTPKQQKLMAAAESGAAGGGPGRGEPVSGGTEGRGAAGGGAAPGRAGGGRGAKKPVKNANPLGWAQTMQAVGMANDPSATVSLLGMRGIGAVQGAVSKPSPHEQARQDREGQHQRQEMIRQQNEANQMQATAQTRAASPVQSSLQASLTAAGRPSDSPPVRSGLRS